MPTSTYILNVRRPVPLLSAILDVFCGDAHMSLEGDLSKLQWSTELPIPPRISVLLRRQTAWPAQDYIVLPLNAETIPEIKRVVLPVIGLRQRVAHVQIEQHGQLVFGAYDWFGLQSRDSAWVAQSVGTELLDRLIQEGCLRSYKPGPDESEDQTRTSPEYYLVDLLTEQDVTLDEAFRAFNGEREHILKVLSIYIDSGSVLLKYNDQVLPDWKARELMRDPAVFETHGHVCITPGPIFSKAREAGMI